MQNLKCLILSQTYYFWVGGGGRGRGQSTTHNWKVIYHAKSEVLDLESNLLFPGGGGVIYYAQFKGNYYAKSEVLDLESNLLILGEG